MSETYNPAQIEQSVINSWQESHAFEVKEDLCKEKYYCLTMFPYPSGSLHMGHIRVYTISDVIARYQRMLGKNVLHPMGWDAFGLPAENAAHKHDTLPAKWTYQNIADMKKQFNRFGFSFDWKREITTCKPEYYKWEQWFFLRLFEKGLAYKKNALVNWDPVDQTVLANEQVIDGKGWRSGAPIERKEISQWFLKITEYADELLESLDDLDEWPEQVKTMQRNWIGKSKGVEIIFEIPSLESRLKIFTTRVDTLYGASYCAIAAGHPIAQKLSEDNPEISDFIKTHCSGLATEAAIEKAPKKGIDTGIKAIHPLTQKEIPIFIANYVLMDYGQGAVMAVPAHDGRDYEIAKTYQLPIVQVIDGNHDINLKKEAYTGKGILIDSGQFTGLSSDEAIEAISHHLETKKQGTIKTHTRLRDWGVSRQRYWGTPIPIINCEDCGAVPVPDDDLPVVLPEDVTFSGATSPLKSDPNFYEVKCPKCNSDATRETDTFDTFVESSWYYARYASFDQDKAMLDDRASYWTPVDYYIGGVEHAVMHLLYARFFHKLMRDENLVFSDEPFTKLLTQGMVLNKGAKMSKSRGNTVSPTELVNKYGADTVRLFITFAAPPEQALEWSDSGVEGAHRFLKKLYKFSNEYNAVHALNIAIKSGITQKADWENASELQLDIRRELYEILQQSTNDFERSQFNTVISGAMKLLNLLLKLDPNSQDKIDLYILHDGTSILLRLLSPFTPHICQYLWEKLEYGHDISRAPWPKVIKQALISDNITYVVQVNGKLRSHVTISNNADDKTIEQMAKCDKKVKKFIENKILKKAIILPKHKLINLVVNDD